MLTIKRINISLGSLPAEPEARNLLDRTVVIKVGKKELYNGDVINIATVDNQANLELTYNYNSKDDEVALGKKPITIRFE